MSKYISVKFQNYVRFFLWPAVPQNFFFEFRKFKRRFILFCTDFLSFTICSVLNCSVVLWYSAKIEACRGGLLIARAVTE